MDDVEASIMDDVFSTTTTGWPEERTSKATPRWLALRLNSAWSTHCPPGVPSFMCSSLDTCSRKASAWL